MNKSIVFDVSPFIAIIRDIETRYDFPFDEAFAIELIKDSLLSSEDEISALFLLESYRQLFRNHPELLNEIFQVIFRLQQTVLSYRIDPNYRFTDVKNTVAIYTLYKGQFVKVYFKASAYITQLGKKLCRPKEFPFELDIHEDVINKILLLPTKEERDQFLTPMLKPTIEQCYREYMKTDLFLKRKIGRIHFDLVITNLQYKINLPPL